jgi:hypothetical protein
MSTLRAKSAAVERHGQTLMLNIRLVGGSVVAFPLSHIKGFTPSRLRAALPAVFAVRVEERGGAIAWPELDIDFSVAEMVPYLLGITTASESARRAGSATSDAKTAAARSNGARGGRPRKATAAA